MQRSRNPSCLHRTELGNPLVHSCGGDPTLKFCHQFLFIRLYFFSILVCCLGLPLQLVFRATVWHIGSSPFPLLKARNILPFATSHGAQRRSCSAPCCRKGQEQESAGWGVLNRQLQLCMVVKKDSLLLIQSFSSGFIEVWLGKLAWQCRYFSLGLVHSVPESIGISVRMHTSKS